MKRKRRTAAFFSGIALLAIMAIADIAIGKADASIEILWFLRAPRVATAIMAGAALSLAGTQMQSVLRNPLADPHIMGVSAGASLGAAIATLSGHGSGIVSNAVFQGLSLTGAAFLGALLSAMAIIAASKHFSRASTVLIFGVMLGFIVNAIVSILQFASDAESLKIFYNWSAGSFSNTTWPQIVLMLIISAAGAAIAIRNRKGLDIILFGDEFAELSGAKPGKIRFTALISSCMLTSTVTAFCGPIGFVGIVAPHIARGIFKTSAHEVIIPASLLAGSIISLTADVLSRLFPTPLPVASTMAVVGIPIILYIIIKGSRYEI